MPRGRHRAPVQSPLGRLRELHGLRAFVILWSGQILSAMGTRMINFMLGILVWQRTGQVSALSLLTFFAYGATVVCSPLAGSLVDRISRRLTIMLSDVGSACTTAIMLVLFLTGQANLWALIVTNTLTGAFLAFQFPAYAATIATMLPKEQYPRANGMMSLVRSLPTIVGPALASLLLKAFGASGVLTVCIGLYLVAIGTVFLVSLPSPSGKSAQDDVASGRKWAAGFLYIARRPGLAGLLTLTTVVSFTSALGYVAVIPMILARTGNNQVLLGTVQSVGAAGGVCGALALTAGRAPPRKVMGVIAGILVYSLLGQVAIGVGRTVPVWVVAWFFAWLAVPFVEGYSQTIWQQKAAPSVRGRVFAAVQLSENLALPVGFAVSGLLTDHYLVPLMKSGKGLAPAFARLVGNGPAAGIALIFVLAGAVGTVCALAALAIGSVRNVESRLPDGDGEVEELMSDTSGMRQTERTLEVEHAIGRHGQGSAQGTGERGTAVRTLAGSPGQPAGLAGHRPHRAPGGVQGVRGRGLDGYDTGEPAEYALTPATDTITLPADVDMSLLRSSWRQAADALRSQAACPSSATPLWLASWTEHDDALHELLVAEFRSRPVRFVGGLVIGTGTRVALHVCGNPAWVDASMLSLLLADVRTTYDAMWGSRPQVFDQADNGDGRTAQSAVHRLPAPAARPELVVLRDAGRPHLHLYYPAIGAEAAYQQLAAALPANWTVTTCADADHAESVEEMATWYLSALHGRFSKPDLLGGWSMGGLVGLEAARQLLALDAASRLSLVLVDSPPPGGFPSGEMATDSLKDGQLAQFCEFLWRSFGISGFQPRSLDTSGEDQVGLSFIAVTLRHAGEDVPIEWLSEWLAGYRRQLRLLATCQGVRPVRASGLLVVGDLSDADVQLWRRALDGPLTVRESGGGHFDLLRPPLVADVARLLAAHDATLRAG